MRAELPAELPLICPACRLRTEAGREMHTVALIAGLKNDGNEIDQGVLSCTNVACQRRYPIIAGIPILLPHLGEFLRTEIAAVVEGEILPPVAAVLANAGPDDAPYPRMLEQLSVYMDAHWGDHADPAADGPAPPFGYSSLAERLATRSASKVDRVIELGCGVGRGLGELARGASLAVGVDVSFGALRRARRLLAGHPVPYARRTVGRHYSVATARAGDLAAGNVAFICGDALDPPVAPSSFERVAAINLIDNVRVPGQLISVMDGLCLPGGELIVASPYSWVSGIVDEDARLGGSDPAGTLRRMFTQGEGLEARYTIQEDSQLHWWLRRDARSAAVYEVHYLRAQKAA